LNLGQGTRATGFPAALDYPVTGKQT
jgi:hypothetical protein